MSDPFDRLKAALASLYRVERELGSGGMATVYLAHDLKHDREVAVKVLRQDIAETLGADRFLREVRIAAQLTHPHILGLHDSGEADGFLYYVMPYIAGESLRARIAREGDLPVPEVVRIVREVVDALSYAHAHHVVHRDIKPDNVMLAGRHAMVTDFGVAKAVSEATGRNTLTTAGVALGTPSYMAPEQATADPLVDHRADFYAVGVMAYELLCGEPPFTGTTPQQVLAAHISQAPVPPSERRRSIPPALEQFVMKCLEKRASDRWQRADEMLAALEALATPSGGITPTGMTPMALAPRKITSTKLAVATGVVVAIAVLGFLGWTSLHRSGPTLTVADIRQVTRGDEIELDPHISPDGTQVAYTVWDGIETHVLVRDIEGGRPIVLAGGAGDAQTRQPVWTSDGRSVVFSTVRGPTDRRASLVPRFGGTPRSIANGIVDDVSGDVMAVVRGDSIFVAPVGSGNERLALTASEPYLAELSPDGSRLAFVTGNRWSVSLANIGSLAPSTIWVAAVEGGEPVAVTDSASTNTSPVWMPDGRRLLFISNRDGARDVYALRIDESGHASGPPVRLTTGLEPYSISLSADGTKAVYSRFLLRRNVYAIPIPTTGSVSIRQARPLTSGNQVVEALGVSPDGTTLAFDANREGSQDIFVVPTDGGEPRQLTTDSAGEYNPDFSPDGREIVYYGTRYGSRDVFVLDVAGGTPVRLTDQPGQEYHPQFSPDGRSIAYVYQSEGQSWLYVMTRDSPTGTWGSPRRLTPAGVNAVAWSPDGQSLFYTTVAGIMTVTLDGDSQTILPNHSADERWADVVRDGGSLYIMARNAAQQAAGLYVASLSGGQLRIAVRFDDPTRPIWSQWDVRRGVAYFAIGEYESDLFAMDLTVGR